MYSSDSQKHLSAGRTWQRATYAERKMLLLAAGHTDHIRHTYKHFDQLPPEIKLDLNKLHTQKQLGQRRVIDVLRNAQAIGCKLVIDNGEVVVTPTVLPGQREIGFFSKVAA